MMFTNLLKATISTVLLPVAIVKDVVTLGGELTGDESAVVKSCKNIGKNLDKAVDPDE